MNNNKIANIEVSNKPLIFTKKVNDKSKIIPLNLNNNTLGEKRYFPPASKEWLNSVYAYNSNYIKSLPVADKNLMKIIQSYFNFFQKNKNNSKRKRIKSRHLLVSKIFVGKAELKHTSSKVVITLYVYNKEKEMLANKIKNLEKNLFPASLGKGKSMKDNVKTLSFKDKFKIIERQKSYIMEQVESEKRKIVKGFITNGSFNTHNVRLYKEFTKNFLKKELIAMTYYKSLLDFNKLKFEDAYLLRLSNLLSKIYNKDVEFNIVSLKYLYLNSDILSQAIALKLKNRKNKLLRVLKSSLRMVKIPVSNEIVINRVPDKYDYLMNTVKNINIYSTFSWNNQLLLNTRDSINKILLGIFPNGQGLPLFYKKKKASVEQEALLNFSASQISSLEEKKLYGDASQAIKKKAGINSSTLSKFFLLKKPILEVGAATTAKIGSNAGIAKGPESEQTVEKFLFNNLKHKAIGGVRLEAKGRLTRRFTASRSVFKVKWKGNLKNIDSSYKGLSTVMLRGHAKSNVQYTNVNSKNRNGSFGIKGWVSSK